MFPYIDVTKSSRYMQKNLLTCDMSNSSFNSTSHSCYCCSHHTGISSACCRFRLLIFWTLSTHSFGRSKLEVINIKRSACTMCKHYYISKKNGKKRTDRSVQQECFENTAPKNLLLHFAFTCIFWIGSQAHDGRFFHKIHLESHLYTNSPDGNKWSCSKNMCRDQARPCDSTKTSRKISKNIFICNMKISRFDHKLTTK